MYGVDGLRWGVGAVENFEIRCVEALDADADAVEETEACQGLQVGGGEVFGVGLERGLLQSRGVVMALQGGDDLLLRKKRLTSTSF